MTGFCSLEEAVKRLRARLATQSEPGALVALRAPAIERIAWQRGRPAARALERSIGRAFLGAARQLVRAGDVAAHDPGSDCFAVAMVSAARGPGTPLDARSAQERMAAAVASSTGEHLEGGWSSIESLADLEDPSATVARALERGARERERYEFLAAVGHELRTPLTSIRGYIETVLDESVHEPVIDVRSTRVFLGSALREAQRMSRLVDGMLEFSLLDLSARGTDGQICDAGERVRCALDAIRPMAVERGARIFDLAETAGCVRIAPDALAHVLVNVLENAIKYGRERGGRIRVTAGRTGPYVVLAVDDDGPGIAASERCTIFGMRVRGSAAAGRGSGIGLAIARSIVERAGGDVAAARSPWGGARFTIRLRGAESEPAAS